MYEPVTPTVLKRILEQIGYTLFDANAVCWMMECGGHLIPISQTMTLVPSDVLDGMLGPAGIDADAFNSLARDIQAGVVLPPKTATARPN